MVKCNKKSYNFKTTKWNQAISDSNSDNDKNNRTQTNNNLLLIQISDQKKYLPLTLTVLRLEGFLVMGVGGEEDVLDRNNRSPLGAPMTSLLTRNAFT